MRAKHVRGLKTAAEIFDKAGFYIEANATDDLLRQAAAQYQDPLLMADSLARVLQHLMYRASPEKHQGYRESLMKGLMRLSPLELAAKSPNNATAVGAAVNIIKNVLMGQPPSVIVEVIQRLERAF